MSKLKLLFLASTLFILCQSLSFGQKFLLQETNVDPKKVSQYLSVARRCKTALQNKSNLSTLPFSGRCTLTNNDLNALADRYKNLFSKELQAEGEGQLIERAMGNERDQVVKLASVFLPAGTKSTTNFVQVVVTFEPGNDPKILNIKINGKDHIGILTLTEREINPPKKVEAQKKVEQKKPVTKKKTTTAPKTAPKTKK